MTPRQAIIALVFLLPMAAGAATYLVDPAGGGDFLELPAAFMYAGSQDTVRLAPGTHVVGSGHVGWPITLGPYSPWVVGSESRGASVLQGDGTTAAFYLPEDQVGAKMRFRGITFHGIGELFDKESPSTDLHALLLFIDNTVEECGGWVALDASECQNSGSLISGCTIRNNSGCGITVYHFFGTVEFNEVCHNGGTGIGGNCCEDPLIRFNHVHHNDGHGIRTTWRQKVEDNIIEYNTGAGISIYDGGTYLRNVIRGNQVGIRHWGVLGQIHENDIYGNEEYNIEFSEGYSFNKDLTMNWWGTTDPDEIAAGIWDCEDDPSVGICAVFDPWCTSPGCSGTAAEATSWGAIKWMFR